MIETELKILLDAAAETRLRRHPSLAELRVAARRTRTLVSSYFDTADHRLAAAGLSLRLRKAGRSWVQTIKRQPAEGGGAGLFARIEVECPAPGGRLALDGADPEGVRAAITAAADGAALAPVFETRVRRTVERLQPRCGGTVELALDKGELIAGARRAPILEAELELIAGGVGALYDVARILFVRGPVRFAATDKAARGYLLARGGGPETGLRPRRAGTLGYAGDATVETVARDVLRDCFAQIAGNMDFVAQDDAPEGPHQLRIGLRRLRTAFAIFGPALGADAFAPLGAEARRLGRVVGGLRDLDVLRGLAAEAAALGIAEPARAALDAALAARREAAREAVREALAEAAGFVFDLGALIEGRGWLAPADYGQTVRLAAQVPRVAPAILGKRHRKAVRAGRRIQTLDATALHELRKQLKKLRYAAEMLGPIYPKKAVADYVKPLRSLQDLFGSLNDATMAAELLGAAEPADPRVERAAGFVLGALALRAGQDRPGLDVRWKDFAAAKPFWE